MSLMGFVMWSLADYFSEELHAEKISLVVE